MKRIVVGGAVDKQRIAKEVERMAGDVCQVAVMGDIEAAMAIKNGEADYYLGACNTGGGGALAMAIAILGMGKCATISMPGRPPVEEAVRKFIAEGKVAFGFTTEHIEQSLKMILPLIHP
jgi:hypothetical protein